MFVLRANQLYVAYYVLIRPVHLSAAVLSGVLTSVCPPCAFIARLNVKTFDVDVSIQSKGNRATA